MNKSKNYYENIDTEYERLLKYISSSEKKINDLSSFFNEIYSNTLNLYKLSTKKLTSFFDISKVSEVITKSEQNMTFFYQTSLLFLNNLADIIEKLNHIIITPINDFKANYIKENKTIRNDFLLLLKDYKIEKQNLISYQKEYYYSLIEYIKIKNNYHSLAKNKKEQKDKLFEEMSEQKSIMKIKKQLYKYKVGAINIIYKNFDLRYKKYYKSFESNERNKLIFLYNTIRIFSLKIKELTEHLNELSAQINSKLNSWKVEEDKNLIKDEFNYIGRYINSENIFNDSNTLQRFNKEIYLPYNMTNMNYINNFYNINEILKTKSSKSNGSISMETDSQNINIKEEKITSKNLKNEKFQKDIINQFYILLYNNKIIPYDLICNIIEIANNDIEFCLKFINNYYFENKNKYFQINKEKNIRHLCDIFLNILYSIREKNENGQTEGEENKDNKDNIKIYIKILRIGQMIYFISNNKNTKQNIFLSGLLNKYFEFQNNIFWENLLLSYIEIKLKKLYLKLETNKSNNKELNDKGEEEYNNENQKNNFKNLINNSDIFISSTNIHKKENKNNDQKISSNQIEDKYLQKACTLFHRIIIEFINFLINYNFGYKKCIFLIKKICIKFDINNDLINFYISYINIFSYSAKQYSQNNSYYKLNKKIEEIKLNHNKDNKDNKIQNQIINEENKILIILSISKYLDNNKKIKLLLLNKSIYQKIHRKIYKNILFSSNKNQKYNINNKIHINIWKNILNYKDIKKKYPYEILKKKTFSKKHLNYEQSDFYIIDLDCQRTIFENNLINNNKNREFNNNNLKDNNNDKNKIINNYQQKLNEMKRMSLNNILKTLITLNHEQTYCQGMNFIGAFLLRILNEKEDDTFYFMTGLFKCTTYPQIFTDNLVQLTLYFNIFNVLLLIFIPNLYYYFKDNNIIPNYYLSSCFITLFTNYANKEKKINLFIKIFDLFIIDGWKGIFNILLEIMWHNDEKILSLKNENLLHFLNANLINDFLVNYKDYNCFGLNLERKVTNKLIKNIEKLLLNSAKLGISIE